MKRKLRKSLSWLLTVAMVASLFCGAIPTASAVEQNSNTSYINVEYEGSSAPIPRTDLTIQVKSTEGQDLQSIELNDTWSGGFASMTISIQDQWLAQYEIADISISGTAADIQGNTPGVGDDTMQSQTFTWTAYGDKTTITVTLGDVDPNRILKLQNDEVDIGTITYIPGDVKTNINVYLNNSDEPVTTFKNIGIQNMRAMNFVLNLKSGYFYGDARRSIECDPVGTTWTNQRYITFTQPNQTNTLDLYFFTFEDGVNLDFERTVNMNATSDLIDEACPSLTVSYTINGKTYTITHDTWDQTGTIYVPKNTTIYVSPNIQDGYGFNYWIGHDNWTAGNSIYTLDANGEIVASTGDSIIAQSEDMALNYGAPGYSDGEVYLRMRDGRSGYEFYTVTYEANGGEGKMDSQTFSEYPVYIRNNEFTREGYTFTGWNTEADGSGTAYQPNGVYSEAANLPLYAQWQEAGTEPTPDDEYSITGFTKELVDDPENVPNGLDSKDFTFPNAEGVVTVPVNAEVTLLYKLTVTGDEGASYKISDDATLVDGYSWEGTIGSTDTAVIYVTKTFDVSDINPENSTLTNTAMVASGDDDTTVDDGVNDGEDNTEETNAEEGAPVPPTDDELEDLFGEGTDGAVLIHCTTAETSFNHEDQTYGLLENGFQPGAVSEEAPYTYTYTITVTPGAYVTQYSTDIGKEHTLNPGQPASQKITLTWTKDTGWEVTSQVPVVYTVTCDDENDYDDSYGEFHVMNLTDIKQAVADEKNITDIDNIKIYTIGVTGTVARTLDSWFYGDVAETTGGATRYWGTADLGYATGAATINGYLTDYSAWKILNNLPFIDNDTVTSITIYYKYNAAEGSVTVPCTDFEKIVRLEDKPYITQIWLDVEDEPEPEPKPEYTLTYNYNDATEDAEANTETDNTKYASGAEVQLKEVSHTADNDGVVFVGWTENPNSHTKSAPATESPDGLVTEVTFQDKDITVYAAWAQDANNDGTPDYEEGFVKQDVYVYAKPTGSGPNNALTADEANNLEETYNLTLNNSGYCVLGKLTNVLLPVAAEQDPDTEYYSTYASVIKAAFDADDKFVRHPGATYNSDLIDVLVWNHLSVAAGAEGYETEAPSNIRCWHLDGDLDVTFKYDLTFHANGGSFTGQADPDTLIIHDLTIGKHEISGLTGYRKPSYDTSNVEFAGWATKKPSKEVYEAGDTDVPATVTSVTLPTTQELWAVWGYDTDGDGTADVNQIVITPADITIYTGGDGYSGIVTNKEGTSMAEETNGFPEPGYYITLPTNLNNALLEAIEEAGLDMPDGGIVKLSDYVDFTYDKGSTTREWVMSTYDEKGESRTSDNRYIYRLGDSKINGGSETIAIRISITDSDGTYVGSDSKFTPATDGLYQTYSMTINPGELDRSAIQLSLRSNTTLSSNSELASLLESYGVFVDSGDLIVRGVNDKNDTNHVREIEGTAPATAVNQITAHADSDVSYNINDSDLAVADGHQIMLLVDTLTDSFEDTEKLKQAALSELTEQGIDTEDLTFTEFRYLDLVDNSNGNAYVTLDDGQTVNIYWPNPADGSEAYYVIHFDKLDRNHTDLNTALGNANISVYSSVDSEQTASVKDLVVDGSGNLVFATGSFSPFVVAYRDGGSTPPAPQEVTVTFQSGSHGDFGGNTTTQTVQVTTGGQLNATQIPTVYADSNYRFDGWSYSGRTYSTSELLNLSFNSDAIITATYSYVGGSHGGSGGGSGGSNDNDSDPTGNLSIAVDVNGDGSFTFTVILTDKDGDDLENNFYFNGDFTGTIGSGDGITLENGEEIIIRNLPEGTRYEIIVEDADGFHLIADGDTGIIHTGMNEAEFTGNPVVQLADPSVTGVSRWLNVTDHIAYLTGYPSGGFGPDNSMTRAEVAQMFYALLQNKDVPITRTFPDVPADAWYATAVNTLASLGMVSGDETGNYRPNDPITRAEFCVIALAFAYEPENTLCWFTDVNTGDWFYSYVAQAASYGWIGGYTDGTFGPNNPITRAQVTTIVNNMLGRAADRDYVLDHQEDLVQFNDLTRGHWAFFQIMEATNAHDYTIRRGEENWR